MVRCCLPVCKAVGDSRVGGGDGQEAVVLGDAFPAGGGAGFDLSAAGGDGEVGDESVGCFSGAVGNHRGVAGIVANGHGVQGFGDGTDPG